MAKNIPGSFTPFPTIKHSDGYQFQQRGGRVYVEDDQGNEIASITNSKLQATAFAFKPVYLTTKELQALAKRWLAENVYYRNEA